jgi:hypothetical protein
MKTLFSNQIFGANFAPRKMASTFGDLLNEFGISESDIEDLIGKLPTEAVGSYRARFEECKAKGVTSGEGVACLYSLYKDLKSGSSTTPSVPAPTTPKTTTAFPVVPVVIVAVILAGVGIYFAVKK